MTKMLSQVIEFSEFGILYVRPTGNTQSHQTRFSAWFQGSPTVYRLVNVMSVKKLAEEKKLDKVVFLDDGGDPFFGGGYNETIKDVNPEIKRKYNKHNPPHTKDI